MGSPSATSICIAIPVVMPAFSLRSNASITTGYSDGRPTGVFIVDPCLHAGNPDVCPPGANGDKTPCMRESPRGCPFSNPWYLPLRSVASITTGYSDGRPTGVFIVDPCLHAGYPDVCPPGANGDKTPCMRESPRGCPFSNPWYLPLRSVASITTGYSDGRPTGVFIVDPCLHAGNPDVCPLGAATRRHACERHPEGGLLVTRGTCLRNERSECRGRHHGYSKLSAASLKATPLPPSRCDRGR